MSARSEQKLRTRRNLLDATLEQLGPERNFSGLSLREVTRAAGIAPTSFYRHFDDMNDLGLALVEEAGLALRQLMRKARSRIQEQGTAIDTSVDTFMEYLINNTNHFRLLLQERSGNSQEFRTAIHLEIKHFVAELEEYLKQRAVEQNRPALDVGLVADAMVTIVFHMAAQALDASRTERQNLADKAKQQLRMIMAGAIWFASKP